MLVQIMGNEIQKLKSNYSVLPEYNECVIPTLKWMVNLIN